MLVLLVLVLMEMAQVKPGRRTVEVMMTPVKETMSMEVAGKETRDTIPLSPIKIVSFKNSR